MTLLLIDDQKLGAFLAALAALINHLEIDDDVPESVLENYTDAANVLEVHLERAMRDVSIDPTPQTCSRCNGPLGFFRWCSICLVHDDTGAA